MLLIGIANHCTTISAVNGTKIVNGMYLIRLVNTEDKIILITLAHELAQFSLTLGTNNATDYGNT